MSAYVLADQLNQKLVSLMTVLVSEKAWKMEGSRTFIELEEVPLIDLLRGQLFNR